MNQVDFKFYLFDFNSDLIVDSLPLEVIRIPVSKPRHRRDRHD